MQTKEYQANNDADWERMCQSIQYELLVRTIVRLAPNLTDEIVASAQEFIDAQPEIHHESLAEPVRFTTERVINKISADKAKNQKESTYE